MKDFFNGQWITWCKWNLFFSDCSRWHKHPDQFDVFFCFLCEHTYLMLTLGWNASMAVNYRNVGLLFFFFCGVTTSDSENMGHLLLITWLNASTHTHTYMYIFSWRKLVVYNTVILINTYLYCLCLGICQKQDSYSQRVFAIFFKQTKNQAVDSSLLLTQS